MKNTYRLKLIAFLIAIGFNVQSFANQPAFLHVNLHSHACGMFSVFSYVVGVLYEYEKYSYAGIEVNFDDLGLYFDPTHGPNWWNYYCEPICIGDKENKEIRQFNIYEYSHFSFFTEFRMSRQQVYEIIQKYIKIKAPIRKKIDQFVKQHFDGHQIISVHYRGTDKVHEAPRVSYDQVTNCIRNYITQNRLDNYRIFVASDEQMFIDEMENTFPGLVISSTTKRSKDGKPLHYGKNKKSNYLSGEEALIDCLLLSRGNFLIRTSSNLSLWSSYFNPSIPVLELSQRNGR